MAKFTGADKTEADSFVSLCDKLCGFPRKGVHVGGGIHVPMPDAFTPGAPGWTSTNSVPADDFSVELIDEVVTKQKDSEERKKLSAPELAQLDALWVKVSTSQAAATKDEA